MSVSGVTNTEKYSKDRGATRGYSDVLFDQETPNGATVMKHMLCEICGEPSFTVDGKCLFQNTFLHLAFGA